MAAIRAFQPETVIKQSSNNNSLNTLLLKNKAGERLMFITEDHEVIKAGGLYCKSLCTCTIFILK